MKTYHAVFGEAISDSITQAAIKSQMLAEIRTHLGLQTFARTAELISLMSSLSKMRTAAASSSSAAHGPVPMEIGLGQEQRSSARARARRKGKGKAEEGKVRGVV